MDSSRAPISVAIPTFRRPERLAATLEMLSACIPAAAETMVHIDAGDEVTARMVASRFPQVRALSSAQRQGPGGGRNKLIEAASNDIVASFDDDSYPMDADYFARLQAAFDARPDAAAVGSTIVHRGETVPEAQTSVGRAAHFVGCGVAYRRADFLQAGGYVPLALAYGMEEVDLALRLTARGRAIYSSPWLRVFHDTDLGHHADPAITSASLSNQALLVFLRYPPSYWPYGSAQVANRLRWLLKAGRWRGAAGGLLHVPAHLWRHRKHRRTVSAEALSRFLRLRDAPAGYEPLQATTVRG